MKYHKQQFAHDPTRGVFGDCYRTSLACMLDLEIDDVPHIVNSMDRAEWASRIQPQYDKWLADRGLMELDIPVRAESLDEALNWQKTRTRMPTYCLLTGGSPRANHIVVVHDGVIIHDPAADDGHCIQGPCDDGLYWFTWLMPTFEVERLTKVQGGGQ